MQSSASGKEYPQAQTYVGNLLAGKAEMILGGPSGHQVEHDPAMCLCHEKG